MCAFLLLMQNGQGSCTLLATCLVLFVHTAKAGTQGSVQNQDAACSAGALLPLLDIIAAGPDQLAAKAAALAISALATNHTANQDAFRLSVSQHAAPGRCATC